MKALLLLVLVVFGGCTDDPEHNWTWGKHKLNLQIAKTPEARAEGLRGKTPLENNNGMLFVYDNSAVRHYWMKGVKDDLALAYFNDKGKVISIHHLTAGNETSVSSPKPARFVLEMKPGWFKAKGIKAGDTWTELSNMKSK